MNDLNNKKLNTIKILLGIIAALIVIFTSLEGFNFVAKYFIYNSPTVEFNKNYIYCQRYEPLSIGGGKSKYSHIDSISLNFVLINDNPGKNFYVGNLHLFIIEDKDENIKELERFIENEEIIDGDTIYQAQYIFENFSWSDIVDYNNTGSFQLMGIPSNDVRVCNIEFYPIDWWDDSNGNVHLYFDENKTYLIILFKGHTDGYFDKDDKWVDTGWKIDDILNENNIHKITIWEGTISNNEITEDEKKEVDEWINSMNELRDKLKSGEIKLEELSNEKIIDLNSDPPSIVYGNIY